MVRNLVSCLENSENDSLLGTKTRTFERLPYTRPYTRPVRVHRVHASRTRTRVRTSRTRVRTRPYGGRTAPLGGRLDGGRRLFGRSGGLRKKKSASVHRPGTAENYTAQDAEKVVMWGKMALLLVCLRFLTGYGLTRWDKTRQPLGGLGRPRQRGIWTAEN